MPHEHESLNNPRTRQSKGRRSKKVVPFLGDSNEYSNREGNRGGMNQPSLSRVLRGSGACSKSYGRLDVLTLNHLDAKHAMHVKENIDSLRRSLGSAKITVSAKQLKTYRLIRTKTETEIFMSGAKRLCEIISPAFDTFRCYSTFKRWQRYLEKISFLENRTLESACVLQRAFLCYLARIRCDEHRKDLDKKINDLRKAAFVQIQICFRASVVIQSAFRVYQSRKKLNILWKAKVEDICALRIQMSWRCIVARCVLNYHRLGKIMKVKAAICIQCLARVVSSKRYLRFLRSIHIVQEKWSQRLKAKYGRELLRKRIGATIYLQRSWRKHKCAEKLSLYVVYHKNQRQNRAAIVCQTCVRSFLAWTTEKNIMVENERINAAALRIQCHIRRFLALLLIDLRHFEQDKVRIIRVLSKICNKPKEKMIKFPAIIRKVRILWHSNKSTLILIMVELKLLSTRCDF